jgi:hypothetical protein
MQGISCSSPFEPEQAFRTALAVVMIISTNLFVNNAEQQFKLLGICVIPGSQPLQQEADPAYHIRIQAECSGVSRFLMSLPQYYVQYHF